MRSPLHGDYYNPKAKQSTVLSEVAMINKATDDVANAAMSIANESASSKAKRQSERVNRREKRMTDNPKLKNPKFIKKTGKIRKKAAANIVEADSKLKAKMEIDKNTKTDVEYYKLYGQKK